MRREHRRRIELIQAPTEHPLDDEDVIGLAAKELLLVTRTRTWSLYLPYARAFKWFRSLAQVDPRFLHPQILELTEEDIPFGAGTEEAGPNNHLLAE